MLSLNFTRRCRLVVGVAFLFPGFWWGVARCRADDERVLKLDAVELIGGREVRGEESIFAVRDGYTYWFADTKNRQAFLADPSRFEIQMGGACARMGPLSGRGTTELHAVVEGKLYLFASVPCREAFLKDPARFIDRDDPRPQVDPAAAAAGRELLERAVQSFGSQPGMVAIRTYSEVRQELVDQNGQKMVHRVETCYRLPGDLQQVDRWDDWSYTYCLVGDQAWSVDSQGESETAQEARTKSLRRMALHHPLVLLHHRQGPDFVAQRIGTRKWRSEQGEEVEVDVVETWYEGVTRRLYLEPDRGRILGMSYRDRGPGLTVGNLEVQYSQFSSVDGIQLPARIETTFEGQPVPSRSGPLTERHVNREADQQLFTRPQNLAATGEA